MLAAQAVGGARYALDITVQYAKDRKQFGRPIGTNQAIAHMLADMQTEVEAARTLMWRAAWMVSTGQNALREISMAKLFTSETYVKVASQGMQVLGGFGYSAEFDMERHFRDSRAADLLYQIISRRHEQRATVITTNLAFKQWGTVFPGAACIVALVDRFAQHCHTIDIDADSWREKHAFDRDEPPQPRRGKRP